MLLYPSKIILLAFIFIIWILYHVSKSTILGTNIILLNTFFKLVYTLPTNIILFLMFKYQVLKRGRI